MNYIAFIEQNQKLYLSFAKELISCSKKSESEINQQPSISSYDTTTNALIQIIGAPESCANQIKLHCNAIQGVINEYKTQINDTYPRHRFSTTHKHYRAEEMKGFFKTARSPLKNTLHELDKLTKKEKDAHKAVRTAEKEHEKLNGNSTTPKNKLIQAQEKVIQRRQELQIIKNNIASAKASLEDREKRYREEATKILKQCQDLEKQYLDQFTQSLTKLCQAAASSEYSNNHATIFQKLISDITAQQNSTKDLNNWAETNGVITPKMIEENDSNVLSATESTTIHQASDE